MGQKQIKNVQNEQLRTILSGYDWNLNNGKYRKLQCRVFFSHCNKLPKIKKLDFRANNEPSILQDISHIHFSASLLYLDLSGNAICSMQKLCFLDMKNLEVLILEWNYVTSLDSFRKNSFKHLQKLKMCNNPLVTFGRFERAKNKKLKQLWLQSLSNVLEKRQTIPDAMWKLAKMDASQLYLLSIGANKRIDKSSSTSFKSIKRKFIHHISLSKSP